MQTQQLAMLPFGNATASGTSGCRTRQSSLHVSNRKPALNLAHKILKAEQNLFNLTYHPSGWKGIRILNQLPGI
jgi:hypothetical protein